MECVGVDVIELPPLGLRLCLGCGARIQSEEWQEHMQWHRRLQDRLSALSQTLDKFKHHVAKFYLEAQTPC